MAEQTTRQWAKWHRAARTWGFYPLEDYVPGTDVRHCIGWARTGVGKGLALAAQSGRNFADECPELEMKISTDHGGLSVTVALMVPAS